MNQQAKDDIAKLFLRVTVGGLMFMHGLHKVLHGHDFIVQVLNDVGLPTFLQYGVPVGEILAPVLVILGIWTRPAAAVVAFTMAFSIFLAFRDRLFTLNQHGGWVVEFNVFFLMTSLAIVFLGAGRYAVQSPHGKWN